MANDLVYRLFTELPNFPSPMDVKKLDWATDGSGVWIRYRDGEDVFIPHSRVLYIRKVKDV